MVSVIIFYVRNCKLIIPVFLFACLQLTAFSQENAAFQQPGLDYRLADDMFRSRNFGDARQLYHEISTYIKIDDPEITTGALFREAISAAELTNSDAPARIDNFIETYPENALAGEANLYLGKIYFRDNKYKDALKAFQGLDASGLSRQGKEELPCQQ